MFRLHPATLLVLGFSLVLGALLTDNPIALGAVILSGALLAAAGSVFRDWLSWWKVCAALGLAALVINPLVNRNGETILWEGPVLPVLGQLNITLEAVAYGAGMGLKLVALVWSFAFLSLTINPDRILGLLRSRGSGSALSSALALRMVPAAMRDATSILDAMRARGLARDRGGKLKVLRSRIPLVKRLASTSLDRAASMAEAMESRGYGSGSRTRFEDYRFGTGDAIVCMLAASTAGAVLALSITSSLSFTYYPSLELNFGTTGMLLVLAPVATASLVLLISWSWRKWNWLKLRI